MPSSPSSDLAPLPASQAGRHSAAREELSVIWKWVLSLLILIYLVFVLTWFDQYSPVRKLSWSPMLALGLEQHWGMFAPRVRNTIYHETVLVRFADGTERLYEFPRFDRHAGQWEKFRRDKVRKLFVDNLPWQKAFLPCLARFTAHILDNPVNPPRWLTIVYNSARLESPDQRLVTRRSLPRHTSKSVTFTYRVREKTW